MMPKDFNLLETSSLNSNYENPKSVPSPVIKEIIFEASFVSPFGKLCSLGP